MTDQIQVPCAHCGGVVRVPAPRLREDPRCPRCHESLFTGHPVAVADAAAFERHLARSDVPIIVDFWAEWCGPCRMMAPAFDLVAGRMEPRVRFLKLNTDEVSEVANRFGIRSIPTLIAFAGGRELTRVSGAMNAKQLQQWSEQVLAAAGSPQ